MANIGSVIGRTFGGLFDSNEKQLKKLASLVVAINSLESRYAALSDAQLGMCTDAFRVLVARRSTCNDAVSDPLELLGVVECEKALGGALRDMCGRAQSGVLRRALGSVLREVSDLRLRTAFDHVRRGVWDGTSGHGWNTVIDEGLHAMPLVTPQAILSGVPDAVWCHVLAELRLDAYVPANEQAPDDRIDWLQDDQFRVTLEKNFTSVADHLVRKAWNCMLFDAPGRVFRATVSVILQAVPPVDLDNELDGILPHAFAAVREASRRTTGLRHFDVQLLGGIVLHQGRIAEMKTGEGKTLVATLPLYLNALPDKGAHLVTVNDYLAKRDCLWMGPIYNALGLSVACITGRQDDLTMQPSFIYDPEYEDPAGRWSKLRPITRQDAYKAHITYGTNNEFGFDYLRDNMVEGSADRVERELSYAIVDEVDNILIDEARTPLIVSEQSVAERVRVIPVYSRNADGRLSRSDRQLVKGSGVDHLLFFLTGESDAPHFCVCDSNLIVKPSADTNAAILKQVNEVVASLVRNVDYVVDERTNSVQLTEDEGQTRVESLLRSRGLIKSSSIYDYDEDNPGDLESQLLARYLNGALRAYALFRRDKDYVVKNGQVIIVDEHTGRLMPGRRYSEGLHEALEAKEHVQIQLESVTYATVTFQNSFRMYGKLAGMTGTAATEAEEFSRIYKLDVVEIPTHRPMIREDYADRVYRDEPSKFKAVAKEVKALHEAGRPVLVGTASIETSEAISDLFIRNGIRAQVLNAKNHEREASIVAEAGRLGAVTVATNMAGRGVDIILGGTTESRDLEEWQKEHDTVVSLGGLAVVGTEHHEARRIDNQLRGRAGRQGDPGTTAFFVSLDDEIMRRFGGDRVKSLMQWAGMDDETPIEHSMVTKALANAQVQTEGYHFDVRKHLVEYDDVLNKHREIIYAERRKVISASHLKDNILSMLSGELRQMVSGHVDSSLGEMDRDGLLRDLQTLIPVSGEQAIALYDRLPPGDLFEELVQRVTDLGVHAYEQREQELGGEVMRLAEQGVMLRVLDRLWTEHLSLMNGIRQAVGLRAVAQQQPLVAYKMEGQKYYGAMLASLKHDVPAAMFRVSVKTQQGQPARPLPRAQSLPRPAATVAAGGKKVGRNDPCPCGSGKKFKHCCGS